MYRDYSANILKTYFQVYVFFMSQHFQSLFRLLLLLYYLVIVQKYVCIMNYECSEKVDGDGIWVYLVQKISLVDTIVCNLDFMPLVGY